MAKQNFMNRSIKKILLQQSLLFGSLFTGGQAYAQLQLNVQAGANNGNGTQKVVITATALSNISGGSWNGGRFTVRIPKTVGTGAASSSMATSASVTNYSSALTGLAFQDLLNAPGVTVVEPQDAGGTDDGYIYLSFAPSASLVQDFTSGQVVNFMEFDVPDTWICTGCVEVVSASPGQWFDDAIGDASYHAEHSSQPGVNQLVIGTNFGPLGTTPLPVVFGAFAGRAEGCNALLQWRTESEPDVKRFVVQQSSDGRIFSNIAIVPAEGMASSYSYTEMTGTGFHYRVAAMDLSGHAAYSKVAYVERGDCGPTAFAIVPNPSDGNVAVITTAVAEDEVRLQVMDATGRAVYTAMHRLRKGSNRIDLHLPHLAAGSYAVSMRGRQTNGYAILIKSER